MYDPKHVGVKEFYMILICVFNKTCMSWLLLTPILSMHGSTMKLKNVLVNVVLVSKLYTLQSILFYSDVHK